MKVRRLFFVALLAGTLSVIGCGSDDSSGGGNTNGGGNGDASQVCADCSDLLRAACVEEYADCIALNPNDPECEAGARAVCNL